MSFTKEFNLPSDEELTVDEVNLSLSALRAGAIHLGKFCENENDEFMLCKEELNDPRKCLDEGKAVTKCTLEFFKRIKKHCCKEFNQYANCINRSSVDMGLKHCRNTQAVFDKCVLDNMNLDRPPFGWQAEIHIHHTDRSKPEQKMSYFPDASEIFPHDKIKVEEPKQGNRKKLF